MNAEEVHHSAANHRLGTRFEGHRSTPTGHSADEIETVAMARLSRIVIRLLTWRGGASNSHNYRSKPSARAYAAKGRRSALYALWYNFVRVHKSLRNWPAVGEGIGTGG